MKHLGKIRRFTRSVKGALSGLGAASAFFPAPAALACAVCVTGAGGDPSADAYGWSVLFLMTAPYAVGGSVAAWLVYRYRRAAVDREPVEGSGRPRANARTEQKESKR